jgi:organic hydroperoxide reductase OsmC/OhrA
MNGNFVSVKFKKMNGAHYYEVGLRWNDQRSGTLSAKGVPGHVTVATPPPFPSGREGLWSPEHLFVAAINSCYMTTFLAIADNSKLTFKSFECNAKIGRASCRERV